MMEKSAEKPFEVLVGRIGPTLKRITRRLNGHHSFFDDDDLYQEALSHLWVDFTEGKAGDKTDSYLLQGCYFHLKNYLRTVQDKVTIVSLSSPMGEDGASLEEMLPMEDESPFDALMSSIDVDALCTQYLSVREKDILELFLEGMSMREIGKKLGISHMMVWKIRNRIKEKYVKFSGEERLTA
jgi:RNA polymerase sigma factor (sigma-70 family)